MITSERRIWAPAYLRSQLNSATMALMESSLMYSKYVGFLVAMYSHVAAHNSSS